MKLRKLQLLGMIILMSSLMYAAPLGTAPANTGTLKNWKTVEMTPDLDKDGKKDKLVIEYSEQNDKIYTKFTPYVNDDSNKAVKGQTVEKIFERANFQKDFNNFSREFVKNYPKKVKTASKPVNTT
ncbi:MAG: SH3 domain-containing protein, partial [Pseudoleptotrichia goodfellowii]|nr:SH3 domain-containing protein [Pseudoleptotrichia goodfellowii]